MYLVFAFMPGESYIGQLGSLFCFCVCVMSFKRELTPMLSFVFFIFLLFVFCFVVVFEGGW